MIYDVPTQKEPDWEKLARWKGMTKPELEDVKSLLIKKLERVPDPEHAVHKMLHKELEDLEWYIENRQKEVKPFILDDIS